MGFVSQVLETISIRINIKLDIPIGFQNVDEEDLNCFVTKEYLKYITDISHESSMKTLRN